MMPSELTDTLSLLEGALYKQAFTRLSALKVEDAIYCVALMWSPGQPHSLPPLLGVGLHRERAEWLGTYPDEAKEYMWNPAEFSRFDEPALDLENKHVIDLSSALNKALSTGPHSSAAWAEATAMLNRLAKRVYWGLAMLPIKLTEDYVCYAADLQLSDFHHNIRRSVPSERIDLLTAKGWLGE